MARAGEKPTKSDPATPVGGEIPRQEDFVPRIISLDAIRAIIRRADALGHVVDADRLISWVAGHQLALVTTRQLEACGLSRGAIDGRIRRRMLHRVHQGVYLFGPRAFAPGAREFAAVLACGGTALISHRSGTSLYGIAARVEGPVEVTMIADWVPRRPGIIAHRVPELHPIDITEWRGIPITSPARTLLDFAAEAHGDELERAIAEAYALNLTTEAQLSGVLARYPQRTGASRLRAELDREQGPAWTRSEAERRMKLLLRQAGLPSPQTNRKIAGFQADFVWPEQRLIVEVDGYQFHGHRRAFERDRKRDAAHVLAGYRVIRITWRRLTEEPIAVAVTIARALALAA
jgi:very-short-patch-repair endonuclease